MTAPTAKPLTPAARPWIFQAVVPALRFSWMTQRASTPSGPGKVAGPAGRVLARPWPEARGEDAAARGD